MITIYSPDTQDWSNNGLGVLIPTSCIVKEDAGGAYELEMVHPITDGLRWQTLQRGYLIKAPVPERETPFIQQSAEARAESPEHIIWHVTAATASVYSKASAGYSTWSSTATYSKGAKRNYSGKSYRWGSETPGNATPPASPWVKITTGSKKLKTLKSGTELIYHEDSDTYSKVTTPDGTTGYILKSSIAYKRTEPYVSAQPAYNTAVPPRQIRDQVFRIYDVQISDKDHSVTVNARHISYDQLGNVVKTYSPSGVSIQAALIAMSGDLLNDHDFNYYTNLTTTITAEWALKNAIEAIHDPDNGAVPKLNAQLVRDNYDIFLLENVERDRGVTIAYGKNMLGITSKVNDESAVTRIMPIGYDENGAPILLPELCIDSPYIGDYPTERAVPLDVQEAKVHAAEGEDPGMTLEQAYTKMREAAQAEFDKGCDLVDLELTVDFVHLGDTVEYASMKDLQQVYLYDTVSVRHGPLAILYKTQVIGYEWDAILKRFQKVKMGSIKNGAELGAVAGFQLPSMGISGNKLVPGSVGSSQLHALSVLNAHIANLDAGKIKTGYLSAERIETQSLDADKIKAHDITADQIAAGTITATEIKAGTVTANEMKAGTITAESGIIANAAITDAKIGTAGISFAKIKDLIAGTAIIREGVGGKLFIDRLSVSEANIVNLTAGKIMVLGTDGAFYRLTVDGSGNVVATLTQVSNDNIADLSLDAGEKLIKSSITADCLDVDEIMGGSAFIGKIQTGHIAAGAVTTPLISAPAKASLMLEATNFVKNANIIPLSKGPFDGSPSQYQFKVYDVLDKIEPSKQYTISVQGRGNSAGASLYAVIQFNGWVNVYSATISGWTEIKTITFTAPSSITSASFELYNSPNGNGGWVVCDWFTIAEGTTAATDWNPAPDDPVKNLKASHVDIGDGRISIETGGSLTLGGANVDMATDLLSIYNADKSKLLFEILAAYARMNVDVFYCPNIIGNVVNTFPGGTIPWSGSITDSLKNIGKFLLATSYLYVPSGYNSPEKPVVPGFFGAPLIIQYADGAQTDIFTIHDGSSRIFVQGATGGVGKISASAAGGYVCGVYNSRVAVTRMRITGAVRSSASDGSLNGLEVRERGSVIISDCTIERTTQAAMMAFDNGCITALNCNGGVSGGNYTTVANLGTGISSLYSSCVSIEGTCPVSVGGNTSYLGALYGTGTPTGSPGTAPAAPSTRTYAVSAGYEKKTESDGSSSFTWNAGEPRQGSGWEWVNDWGQTPFNGFGAFLLTGAANIVSDRPSGKTITAATFKLRRDASAGSAGTIACTLWQHGQTSISTGAPNTILFAQAADAVNISPNQEITITLNASAITNLNNGTCKGFGFKNTGGYGRYDIYGELTVTYS